MHNLLGGTNTVPVPKMLQEHEQGGNNTPFLLSAIDSSKREQLVGAVASTHAAGALLGRVAARVSLSTAYHTTQHPQHSTAHSLILELGCVDVV